jgi:hypothetical protein
MGTTVAMKYATVELAARQFASTGLAMRAMAVTARALAQVLRVSFWGTVFGAEIIRRLDLIHDKANALGQLCEQFSRNLRRAIADHKNGDYQEGAYFADPTR